MQSVEHDIHHSYFSLRSTQKGGTIIKLYPLYINELRFIKAKAGFTANLTSSPSHLTLHYILLHIFCE